MASNKAHHATGWAAGLMAAAVISRTGGGAPHYIAGLCGFLTALAGATAPDWLEVAWWSRKRQLWITHRTLTHWGLGWVALLILSYHWLGLHLAAALSFGFAAGGLMHLLADWPNPLGVPWIFGRHSLNWWNSGRCDLLVVAAAWVAALLVSDHMWFHDLHSLQVLHSL